MHRLILTAFIIGTAIACSDRPFFEDSPTDPEPDQDAVVEILAAARGRVEPTRWSVTLDMENQGGPGQFYLHLQGVSIDPDGPRTECGLTPERSVPGSWRETVAYVIECPRTPQWVTVYTRSTGEQTFRETDTWVY